MVIANDFEIFYLLVAFALPGVILIGGLLDTRHLQKLHPQLVGALMERRKSRKPARPGVVPRSVRSRGLTR
ncbi:hypothetical protein [Paraburkholderia panacisoli]|uniref:hypothetical protein n=1 Tax=Paraburkholderia panacisoli TaxID=2603818 RepID=UPI00165F8430|nr:hypothetical protein [Paraburkholderia panacisoli]